jgi:hypothetical protein
MQHLNGLNSKFAVEFREANERRPPAAPARRVIVVRVGRAGFPRSLEATSVQPPARLG